MVEGIGILAVVLQWAPLLLQAVAHVCVLQVIDAEVTNRATPAGFSTSSEARGGEVVASEVIEASRRAYGNCTLLARPVQTEGAAYRPRALESFSVQRATSPNKRQHNCPAD